MSKTLKMGPNVSSSQRYVGRNMCEPEGTVAAKA